MREEEMRTGAGACFHRRSLGRQRCSQALLSTGSPQEVPRPSLPPRPELYTSHPGGGAPWLRVQTLYPRLPASSPRFNTCKLCGLAEAT